MATTKAVEKAAPAGVPALATTPSVTSELSSSDVALPRIRIGQGASPAVADELVKLGDIYASSGKDDPEPKILSAGGDDADGVLIHVLGIRKGKSLNIDNELNTWEFNDPDAPPEARTTYDYTVVVPEVDDEVPYKFLLQGSSTPAAKLINTVLVKNADRGPSYALAFRIKTAKRESEKNGQKFKYHVARARQEEAKQSNVEIAADLAEMIAGSTVEKSAPSNPPRI